MLIPNSFIENIVSLEQHPRFGGVIVVYRFNNGYGVVQSKHRHTCGVEMDICTFKENSNEIEVCYSGVAEVKDEDIEPSLTKYSSLKPSSI
ncbi:hypothetical protein bcgnr5390_17450 [Bacillus luti]|nr:hypothetical protein BC2903_61620 [Bacillus cereus]